MNKSNLVIPVFESVEKLQEVFGNDAKFLHTDTCESVPEPRKPREYWLEIARDGSVDTASRAPYYKSVRGGELVLVREVIE